MQHLCKHQKRLDHAFAVVGASQCESQGNTTCLAGFDVPQPAKAKTLFSSFERFRASMRPQSLPLAPKFWGSNAIAIRRASLFPVNAFAIFLSLTLSAAACDKDCEAQTDQISKDILQAPMVMQQGRNNTVVATFGEGVPLLKCRTLTYCSIQLQPGEWPTDDPLLGDERMWDINMRISGSTEDPNVRFVVKPQPKATSTNLVIATDRRHYDLQLVKSDSDYTQVLAFRYPADERAEVAARIAAMKAEKARQAAVVAAEVARKSVPVSGGRSVSVDKLNFNYRVTGKAPFKPTRVFNDRKKTYIDLPEGYSGEKPVFFAGDTKSSKEVVNSRWKGNRLEIDRVIATGTLILGVGRKADKITIKRVKGS